MKIWIPSDLKRHRSRLDAAIERVETVYRRLPRMRVVVTDLAPDLLGTVTRRGYQELFLSKRLFRMELKDFSNYMPIARKVPLLDLVLAHEVAHCIDKRPQYLIDYDMWARHKSTSMVPYGRYNEIEAWAEAWAEFYLSEGRTKNKAALWYAERYEWRIREC